MATTNDGRIRVRAQHKYARMSARKARLVLDHIRDRTVPEARTILAFTPRAAATEIEKVLRSAVANAETNSGLDGDDLVVEAAYADEGPTLKRWRARARGRVNRIKKRTCHVTLVLVERPEERTPRRRRSRGAAQAEEQTSKETQTKTRARKPRASRKRAKEGAAA